MYPLEQHWFVQYIAEVLKKVWLSTFINLQETQY